MISFNVTCDVRRVKFVWFHNSKCFQLVSIKIFRGAQFKWIDEPVKLSTRTYAVLRCIMRSCSERMQCYVIFVCSIVRNVSSSFGLFWTFHGSSTVAFRFVVYFPVRRMHACATMQTERWCISNQSTHEHFCVFLDCNTVMITCLCVCKPSILGRNGSMLCEVIVDHRNVCLARISACVREKKCYQLVGTRKR